MLMMLLNSNFKFHNLYALRLKAFVQHKHQRFTNSLSWLVTLPDMTASDSWPTLLRDNGIELLVAVSVGIDRLVVGAISVAGSSEMSLCLVLGIL